MKLLIATVLLGALGAGSFHFATAGRVQAPDPQGCEATVTCNPDGTCVITCHRPDGSTCSIELACDGEHCRVISCQGTPDGSAACAEACGQHCR